MADEFNFNSVFNFAEIQKRVDNLYDTKWYQPNACYPVCFFYTDSEISSKDFTIDKFLKFHTNVDKAVTLTNESKHVLVLNSNTQIIDTVPAPKNLTEYLNIELSKIADTGVTAGDDVLRNFSKVTGLKSPTMAVSKKDGTIATSKDESGKDATVNLEFLCDRELKTLSFLQAWESRWVHRDYQKKAFLDKTDNTEKSIVGGSDGGGEGFLGILNCSIDVNGNITPLSHLSLFGLIPKNIEIPSEFGPQAGSNSMPKITVKCTYSNAVLVYPSHDGKKLQYFYYV